MLRNNEEQTLTEKAIQRLQGQQGRVTEQRRLILETLETLPVHPTAEDVYLRVRQTAPHVNLSTVYRTLRWLQKEGLVSGRVFSEDERQERFDANMPEEHQHFLCRSCKRIIEFDESAALESLIADFEKGSGVLVEHAGLVFHGLCADCREGTS
jgi:Fur family ferric uptake transcriptional regulator